MRPALLRAFLCLPLLAAACLATLWGAAPRRRTQQADQVSQVSQVAQASQEPQSGGQSTAIEVHGWTKPESGWLYVLDPLPADPETTGGRIGRILLLNPATGKAMGLISTGPNPDFALSPDGSLLFVAADVNAQWSDLAVIDTATGQLTQTSSLALRVAPSGLPAFSTMSASQDGFAVRMLVNSVTKPDTNGWQIAIYDTRAGDFLPQNLSLGDCGSGPFVEDSAPGEFEVLCPLSNRIRVIRVDDQSHPQANLSIEFPWERRLGLARAFPTAEAGLLAIARGDGAILTMNLATLQFTATPVQGEEQGRVLPARWPVSPDGRRVYLGYSHNANHRFYLDYGRSTSLNPRTQTADELDVYDTASWKRLGVIKTKKPFWTAVAASDGKTLYAPAPNAHSILVIDTATARQTGAISTGGTPALILVAP